MPTLKHGSGYIMMWTFFNNDMETVGKMHEPKNRVVLEENLEKAAEDLRLVRRSYYQEAGPDMF